MAYYRPIQLQQILNQPQPQIDLRLSEYESTTQSFLASVSAYTSRAIEEINRRKDEHAKQLKRDAEKRKAVEAETIECKVQEIELMKVLEREQIERHDAEAIVSGLKRQLTSAKDKCDTLEVEFQLAQSNVSLLREERNHEQNTLDSYANQISPELTALEHYLKFNITGIQKDLLLFRFTHIDPKDDSREFKFVVDVSDPNYRVRKCEPNLPCMTSLVSELNETRAFYKFLRAVRQAFVESVQPKRI